MMMMMIIIIITIIIIISIIINNNNLHEVITRNHPDLIVDVICMVDVICKVLVESGWIGNDLAGFP